MYEHLPEHLREEARRVEADIRAAFKGVTREGGVSWSGTIAVETGGSEREIAAAATRDTDTCWEELMDNPAPGQDSASDEFSFFDAIGYRYYIAPVIIRCCRHGHEGFLPYALTVDGDYRREQTSLISPAQGAAIARFIRLMIAACNARGDEFNQSDWATAYRLHWKQFDRGLPLE
jgi:hypothetical protein